MGKLDNKVAIVTGAGRGIGRAITAKLAAEGATVAACDINEATAKQTAEAIGARSVGIRTDVTSREAVETMAVQVQREFGRIDVQVNNAGRVGSAGEAVYSAAKGGIIAFTKTIAREMARHQVSANVACPGPTDEAAYITGQTISVSGGLTMS